MIGKSRPNLLAIPSTFYDVSVSCNIFFKAKMRQFVASGNQRISYAVNWIVLWLEISIKCKNCQPLLGTVSNYSPSVSLQNVSRQLNPYHRPCVDLKCPVRRQRTNHPLLKIDTRAPPNLKVINSGLVRTSSFLVQQIETARSKKVTQCQNFQIRARSRPQTGPHSNVITLP